MEPGTFLFLADGRVFVRHDDGEINEASPAERRSAAFALAYTGAGAGGGDPDLGFQLVHPGNSQRDAPVTFGTPGLAALDCEKEDVAGAEGAVPPGCLTAYARHLDPPLDRNPAGGS